MKTKFWTMTTLVFLMAISIPVRGADPVKEGQQVVKQELMELLDKVGEVEAAAKEASKDFKTAEKAAETELRKFNDALLAVGTYERLLKAVTTNMADAEAAYTTAVNEAKAADPFAPEQDELLKKADQLRVKYEEAKAAYKPANVRLHKEFADDLLSYDVRKYEGKNALLELTKKKIDELKNAKAEAEAASINASGNAGAAFTLADGKQKELDALRTKIKECLKALGQDLTPLVSAVQQTRTDTLAEVERMLNSFEAKIVKSVQDEGRATRQAQAQAIADLTKKIGNDFTTVLTAIGSIEMPDEKVSQRRTETLNKAIEKLAAQTATVEQVQALQAKLEEWRAALAEQKAAEAAKPQVKQQPAAGQYQSILQSNGCFQNVCPLQQRQQVLQQPTPTLIPPAPKQGG